MRCYNLFNAYCISQYWQKRRLNMLSETKVKWYLNQIQEEAEMYSGCKKVSVGALIIPHNTKTYIFGFNRTLPKSCKEQVCKRIELYGEDFKEHRLPSDCRAIHSEIDAIAMCAKFGFSTHRATIIITRYPCEACARAIVNAGIKYVYYGREQEISEETKEIFNSANIQVKHVKSWTYEDTTR